MTPPLPNVFVGGAQKSGTTTLHHLLASHPQAFTPADRQEIHFFDLEESYRRGLDWYRSLFDNWSGEPIVFQTSPLYIYRPEVPGRIAAVCPGARFLFILRNPVERAYSHYWHEVRAGSERLSFEEALSREPERLERGPAARRRFSYVDRGRYATQLTRYFDHFPREQIHIHLTEDLGTDPAGVARSTAGFLGVPDEAWVAKVRETTWHRNPAQVPRLRWLQRLVYPVRQHLPWLQYLVNAVNLKDVRYPPMAPRTRARLRRELNDEIESLERLIGRNLAAWREERKES